MRNNKLKIVLFFVFLGVVAMSLSLLSQKQDTRRDAYFAETKFYLTLNKDKDELKQNDEFLAVLNIDSDVKVHGFQTMVCYDKNIELQTGKTEDQIVPIISAGFESEPIIFFEKEIDGKSCIKFAVQGDIDKKTWKSTAMVANIKFKVTGEEGKGKIEIVKEKTVLVGPNSTKSLDHMIEISNDDNYLAYTIVKDEEPPVVSGDGLRFYYAFDGVIKDNSDCGLTWPVNIMVVDKNRKKVLIKNY
jgi:hypothetical protein